MLKRILLALLLGVPGFSAAVDCPTFAAGDTNYIAKLNLLSAGCAPTGGTLTATYIGYGSGANALTGTSDLAYVTATGTLTATKSVNAAMRVNVWNTSAGTGAFSALTATNDNNNVAQLIKYGTGWTTVGLLTAGWASLYNNSTGMLYANTAAEDHVWSRGGTGTANEVMRLGAGTLSVGLAGTTQGSLALKGSTSGTATITTGAAAGTPTLTLPTTTGTLALVAQGTSFPGSPASGDRYFRTDLGLDCYYDGTRWLTVGLIEQPFVLNYTILPITASSINNLQAVIDNGAAGIYLEKVIVNTYVTTTNDGSNYWTIQLQRYDTTNTNTNVSSALSTAADTASTPYQKTITVGAALATSNVSLVLNVTKVSAPGSLHYRGLMVYRLIVT